MRRLGAGRARPASAASCRGDLLNCRLRSETFPMLPSQMTDEASVILRRRPAALGSASRPHQRARSDVVATAALIRRQRPSQSGMLLHSIRPEPTVAADRQPGTRPEDERQLHPAQPAATATALRRPVTGWPRGTAGRRVSTTPEPEASSPAVPPATQPHPTHPRGRPQRRTADAAAKRVCANLNPGDLAAAGRVSAAVTEGADRLPGKLWPTAL